MPVLVKCDKCGLTAPFTTVGWRVESPFLGMPGKGTLCPTCRAVEAAILRAKMDLTKATAQQIEACADALGVK